MLDKIWAENLARDWIASWNAHDIERVLAHYDENFEMESPLIVQRLGISSGRLKGKEAIRNYWTGGLNAMPDLQFKLLEVGVSANTIAIVYESVSVGRKVIEVLEFNEQRLGVKAVALYLPP